MITSEILNSFRSLMLDAVEKCGADKPLFLSGGVDSATILAAQLQLGAKPDCYSFYLTPYKSNDVKIAAMMCGKFELNHRVSVIPREESVLIGDVRAVIAHTGQTFKTHVQCSQPFLYMAEAMSDDGYSEALVGMAAGSLWGDGKEAMFARGREGDKGFEEYRRFCHLHPDNSENSVRKVAAAVGDIKITDPYQYEPLAEFMLNLKFEQLHKPKQKYLAVMAFPEFWKSGAWYRKNSNLQIESGLREWHDTLLKSPLNENLKAKSVVAIYNAIGRGDL